MNNYNDFSLARIQETPIDDFYENATGAIPFTMTNDAVFHMVFEANPVALKAFLCSLLHMKPEEIASIEIKNPLQYSSVVSKKTLILDLRLLLNNEMMIDIEMQVEKLKFWKDRSITYLCRTFDNLIVGENYDQALSAIHIGILDFDLFPDEPEFYGTYHLSNDVTNQKYSDKLRMSVLSLRQVNYATDEDIRWQLDKWARFFKAKTWEEVHMLAEENTSLYEAARTLYRITTNEQTRYLCESIFEGERTYNTLKLEYEQDIAEKQAEIDEQKAEINEQKAEINEQKAEIERLRLELEKVKHTV